VHHHPAAVTVGVDPQIAGQGLPRYRDVPVVEVPGHHDEVGWNHDLVVPSGVDRFTVAVTTDAIEVSVRARS
jgi:hypothetical protein